MVLAEKITERAKRTSIGAVYYRPITVPLYKYRSITGPLKRTGNRTVMNNTGTVLILFLYRSITVPFIKRTGIGAVLYRSCTVPSKTGNGTGLK